MDPGSSCSTMPVKFEWYQIESDVVVTVLKRNLQLDRIRVNFNQGSRLVIHSINDDDSLNQLVDFHLAHRIEPSKCSYKCTPSKVEVKMRKMEMKVWLSLTVDQDVQKSHPTKDWDRIEKEAIEEEEKAQSEGDGAVNQLFQKIYKDADDNVRKAMIKSYSESGGTVLSTNWAEIGIQKTEIKPPDGMEWKKYES